MMLTFQIKSMGFQLFKQEFLKFGVYGVVRMNVGIVFQEYGTYIAQTRLLVDCKLCLGRS